MQELMKMNYGGNMNRGYGGQPQPQRPNNRRNRGGGGPGGPGGPGFRNSRFEHNQQQNRPQQQQQQNNRPSEVKQESPATPAQQANKVNQPPATPAKASVPETPQKPQPQAVAQQLPAQAAQPAPQNQQQQAKPSPDNRNQVNSGPKNSVPDNRNQMNAGSGKQANTAPDNRNQMNSGPDNRNQMNSGPDNRNQMNSGADNRSPMNSGPDNRNPMNSGSDNRNQMNSGPDNRNQMNSGPDNRNQMNSGPDNSNQMNSGPGGQQNKRTFGGPGNKPGGNFGGQNRQSNNFGSGNFGSGNFGPGNKQAGGPGGGQPRNQRGGPRGPGEKMGGPLHGAREDQMLAIKLKDLSGPLIDLAPLDQAELKFNGRSRLYIGNLPSDVTEQEIQDLFSPYGETSELFLNKEKNFAFIRMDYRATAEKAKRELDGSVRRGRPMKVRFAPHNSAVRVRNLTSFVTNELLYRAFEIFGKIERAYVKVDERGKSLNEGVVEYARKASALAALRNCTEKCFFLTSSLRPVIVESFEEPEEYDGYQEKNLPKKHPDFLRSREMGPRFSELNSFEHEYGTRWKQLHELYKQKEDALKAERANEEDKLEAQMEYAKYEHETELLREQLRQREQDRERQKRSWEMAERAAEERRESERAALARQEEELSVRMRQQDDELRRRQQENTLFVQAQRLSSMLDRQEQGMFDTHPQQQNMDGGYMDQYQEMGRGYDDMLPSQHWEGGRHQDDFPNKRRRF